MTQALFMIICGSTQPTFVSTMKTFQRDGIGEQVMPGEGNLSRGDTHVLHRGTGSSIHHTPEQSHLTAQVRDNTSDHRQSQSHRTLTSQDFQ